MNITQPFTQAQMMVLSLVNKSYSDQDLNDLKKTLLQFNHQKMQNHLDKVISENNLNDATFDKILSSHNRISK
ncbi:MAG: hypothetical protein EAZ15_07145 [Sphingobacteriales bacterium]|nr:MAG: hypothetical protein EAZ15_07145 [Sphingobacteriales bacterium]